MKLKACGYYVLIEIPKEEKASSILHIPKDYEDAEVSNSDVGVVLSIGPSAYGGMAAIDGATGEDRAAQWGVKVGDKVEFTRYDGKRPSTEGYESCRFIQDQHIITVIEEQTMGLEEAIDNPEELEAEQPEELEEVNEPSPDETKARSGGWRPKDEWVEAGHDADDWKSAKNFNEFGDVLASLKSHKKDLDDSKNSFDSRLQGVKKIHEAQLAQQLSDLKARQITNVENADTEAYNTTLKAIDDLEASKTPADKPTHNPDQDDLNKWNATNAWINDSTPKAAFAKQEFIKFNNSGFSVAEAIKEMEQSVKSQFPDVNERRSQATRGENPRRSVKAKEKTLSMSEVTRQEMQIMSCFADKSGKVDEKKFLQAVKDSREES